jgi:TonB family protein
MQAVDCGIGQGSASSLSASALDVSIRCDATKLGRKMKKEDQRKVQARKIWLAALCGMFLLLLVVLGTSAQEGRKLIAQAQPIYPATAKALKLTGTVKVIVVIGAGGQIKDAKVQGGHPLFVDATLEALKRWKYAPAPSETTTVLEFNFHP